jgi:hypothetical protein
MMNNTDGALFDAVRNHDRRNSVWLRIVGFGPVGRNFLAFYRRLGEAQDGRVDKWLWSRSVR